MNNLLGDVISSNSTEPVDYLSGFNELSTDTRKGIMFAVHFVGCLWTYYFINACAYTTYAGVGGRWFFSHENGELNVRFYGGCGSIFDSAWCVFTRHLGTMAFGSAILTIIMLIRLVCEYINQKTKDIQETNLPLKFAMCCVRCCLKCLYETVKRVTEYGYIFTAVEGKNFCSSGWSTFDLIAANPGQVWINGMVGSIIYLMIAISIPVVCALLGFLWCDRAGSTDPIWPAVFIGMTSLVISTGVSEVTYHMHGIASHGIPSPWHTIAMAYHSMAYHMHGIPSPWHTIAWHTIAWHTICMAYHSMAYHMHGIP